MFLKKFNYFFALKKLKKPPQKVAHLSINSFVSEIFHLLPNECPTAQMAEFMFQNVVYRANKKTEQKFFLEKKNFVPEKKILSLKKTC